MVPHTNSGLLQEVKTVWAALHSASEAAYEEFKMSTHTHTHINVYATGMWSWEMPDHERGVKEGEYQKKQMEKKRELAISTMKWEKEIKRFVLCVVCCKRDGTKVGTQASFLLSVSTEPSSLTLLYASWFHRVPRSSPTHTDMQTHTHHMFIETSNNSSICSYTDKCY